MTPQPCEVPGTNLDGRTVLFVGGAGGVGEGVVTALLAAGSRVVAAGRSRERFDVLVARIGEPRLATAVPDALGPEMDEVAPEVAGRHGPFDGVVVSAASMGDQDRTPALELSGASTCPPAGPAMAPGRSRRPFRFQDRPHPARPDPPKSATFGP